MVMSEGMGDSFRCPLDSSAETVVFTLCIVVSHVLRKLFKLDVGCGLLVGYNVVLRWSTSFVFDIEVWLNSSAILPLGDINLRVLMTWSVVARTAFVRDVHETVC